MQGDYDNTDDGRDTGVNAGWLSISNGGLGETGLKDLGTGFKGKDMLTSLVRESVQNALDAKRPDASNVSMEFSYQKVEPGDFPDSVRLLRIFSYCKDFVSSKHEKEFFETGMNILSGRSDNSGRTRIGILKISDHGTVGLTGLQDYAENGRFRGLVTRMGMGNDDGARGGNFGVGKQAFFLASKLRTVFFSSIDSRTGCMGHMGVAKLSSFRDPMLGNDPDGKPLCADRTIYYCNKEYNPSTQVGNPVIEGPFMLANRGPQDYGTDVFIIGFDPENEDQFSNEILKVLLMEFIVAIDENRLEVRLPDGFLLKKETLRRAHERVRNCGMGEADLKMLNGFMALVEQPWKLSPTLAVDPVVPPFPPGAIAYKFTRSEDENFCRVTREKGMFVHTVKKVCGSANCIGFAAIRDVQLNAAFKQMENESHTQFEYTTTRFPDKKQRQLVKARLTALERFLKERANEEMGTQIEDQTAAVLPDELEELMNLCAGQFSVGDVKEKAKAKDRSAKPKATRVKKHPPKTRQSGQAEPAHVDVYTENPNEDSGVSKPGTRNNRGRRGSPGGEKKDSGSSPEANGYVICTLPIAPVIYAIGGAASGRYTFSFRVPRSKAKVCLCFSSTTERDSQERLPVKSVSAKDSNGVDVLASPALENTAVSFENVTQGQEIHAEVVFDVSHYCYTQIRYYEKKNN